MTGADHVVTVHFSVVEVLEVAFLPRVRIGAEIIVEDVDRCLHGVERFNSIRFEPKLSLIKTQKTRKPTCSTRLFD